MKSFERDIDEVLEGLKLYSDEAREELYNSFETVLCQEEGAAYYGLMQPFHEDVTEDSTEEEIKAMVDTAQGESSALQNTTIYKHLLTLIDETDDLESFVDSVQNYIDTRSEWNERKEDNGSHDWADAERTNFGETDYIEEVIEDLVLKTAKEAEII